MSQEDDTIPADEKFESNALRRVAAADVDVLESADAATAAAAAAAS